jgi:pyruvate/2-oxoglutarate/acetoin dehydrogenase E1 component
MLHFCLQAAEEISKLEGIAAEVVDLRSIRPLDEEAIRKTAEKTKRVLIVTEANKTCGMSAELFAKVHELVPSVQKVARLAGKDAILACSPVLESFSVPSVEEIKLAMMTTMDLTRKELSYD